MGVIMSQGREGVTVHTMKPDHRGGEVFYTALTRGTKTLKGQRHDREEAKHLLISTLWDHRVATENPLLNHGQFSSRTACPIQVVYGQLGRPHLLVGNYRGPAISFSVGGGKIWGALSGDETDIGIDVAGADEFHREYPFHRVFHPEELEHALRLTSGDPAQASALLWSVKEAVVKALGCAFHLVDPRHINVYPCEGWAAGKDGAYTFPVGLSGKARVRFPLAADRSLWVRSLPQDTMWLSIAHVQRKPAGHA